MPEQEPNIDVSCSGCGASVRESGRIGGQYPSLSCGSTARTYARARRYTERIVDAAGNVVRNVDEPLSEHRGHGTAKRRGFPPGPGAGGL